MRGGLTLQGFVPEETLAGLRPSFMLGPRVVALLQPWAETGQRLRRIQTEAVPKRGLEASNYQT